MTDEGAESAATETPSQGTFSNETTANTAKWPTGPLDEKELRQLVLARVKAYFRLVEPTIYALHYTDSLEGLRQLSRSAVSSLRGISEQLRTAAGPAH